MKCENTGNKSTYEQLLGFSNLTIKTQFVCNVLPKPSLCLENIKSPPRDTPWKGRTLESATFRAITKGRTLESATFRAITKDNYNEQQRARRQWP
jgi:hypothetical protein